MISAPASPTSRSATPAPAPRPGGGGRLLLRLVAAMLALYLLGSTAGYVWLHFVRGNAEIGFTDVALLRWRSVRRSIAAQQFARAGAEWEHRNFQAAYLAFMSALRRDPDNVEGRLRTAEFLTALNSPNQAVGLLEDGLVRAPDHRRLVEKTFELLLSTGRDRRALELLHRQYPNGFSGPNASLLQTYAVRATLRAEGAAPAAQLLERYPGLLHEPAAAPVVAAVRWESQERTKALAILAEHVRRQPDDRAALAQLAGWQAAAGLANDAVATAQQACARFPAEIAPRLQLIEVTAAGSRPWRRAIDDYLKDFGGRPEALVVLAEVAGRHGWIELTRSLYLNGANRPMQLGLLALSYADALAAHAQYPLVRDLLAQVDAQSAEGNLPFLLQLRQRQVMVAAVLGEHETVRDYARRLASLLHGDPDGLEVCRRRFAQLGIAEAVAELSPPVRKPPPPRS